MPWVAIIPAIAAVAGGVMSLIGNENAQNTQAQTAANAEKLQAQQLAMQQAQINQANQVQLAEYQAKQAELAPYLAAHNAVLDRYGVAHGPLPSGNSPAFNTLNSQPTTAAGVLQANPGLSSLIGGAPGSAGSMVPGLAIAGAGALGVGAAGYLASHQAPTISSAGAG